MLVLIFCCHLLGVCVCLGLGQCFRGSAECVGDSFLGIIDLILLQTEGNQRDYHIHIFESGVCFLLRTSTFALPLILQRKKGGLSYIGAGDVCFLSLKGSGVKSTHRLGFPSQCA